MEATARYCSFKVCTEFVVSVFLGSWVGTQRSKTKIKRFQWLYLYLSLQKTNGLTILSLWIY